MKKSMNLYFDNRITVKERLNAIKAAGFEEFHCGVLDECEDISLAGIVEYAANLGLKCTMIHCSYDQTRLYYFWERDEIGDAVCEDYCRQIKKCCLPTFKRLIERCKNNRKTSSYVSA